MAGERDRVQSWRTKDFYGVLGVSPSATTTEIKKGFRKVALTCHPDKVAESERARATKHFQLIGEAYEVLSDEAQRRKYDAVRPLKPGPAPKWSPPAAPTAGGGYGSAARAPKAAPAPAPQQKPAAPNQRPWEAFDTSFSSRQKTGAAQQGFPGAADAGRWLPCGGCKNSVPTTDMRECVCFAKRIGPCCKRCADCSKAGKHSDPLSRPTPSSAYLSPREKERPAPAPAPPRDPARAWATPKATWLRCTGCDNKCPMSELKACPYCRNLIGPCCKLCNLCWDKEESDSDGDVDFGDLQRKAPVPKAKAEPKSQPQPAQPAPSPPAKPPQAQEQQKPEAQPQPRPPPTSRSQNLRVILGAMGFEPSDVDSASMRCSSVEAAVEFIMSGGAAEAAAGNDGGAQIQLRPAHRPVPGQMETRADGDAGRGRTALEAVAEGAAVGAAAAVVAGGRMVQRLSSLVPAWSEGATPAGGGVAGPTATSEPSAEMLETLLALGFNEADARAASQRCSSVEAAVEFLTARAAAGNANPAVEGSTARTPAPAAVAPGGEAATGPPAELLETLLGLGFDEADARRAIGRCSSVEAAVEFLTSGG